MDNFGGIFTTLSQTCKKFHCLKNGQCVDSWENDCLRQKDADSVGCLFNPSFVRGRCPRTARLEVFWGILMTAKHSGSAGGPPPDFFDDPAFAASLYAEADRRAGGADRSARSSRETRDGRSKARQASVQNFSTVQPSKRVPAFAKPNQPYSGMPPVSWSDADLELKPRIEPIAKRSSTRAAWGPQTVASAASGVESSPAAAPRGEEPLSVSAALRRMTNALEGVLDGIWITGEVAEVSQSSLGHLYFSLKDEAALLSCAMFRSALGRGPIFQKGDRIELLGRVDIYAPRR